MERLTRVFKENNQKYVCIDVCGEKCVEENEWCPKCKPFSDVMKKLAEYEDAEEQGKLIRLPCPIGTTVYFVEKRCNADSAACYGGCEKCADYSISSTTFDFDMISHVGNFYFLTKEEAEQALAKMKEV